MKYETGSSEFGPCDEWGHRFGLQMNFLVEVRCSGVASGNLTGTPSGESRRVWL